MKVSCIYGGVGIGKRTVGEALAKKLGYKLFHNHLTIDPALVLLPLRSKEIFPIIIRFRLALLRAAVKHGVKGVVVTAGYYAGENNRWIAGLERLGREKNISVTFVHIHAAEHAHFKRVRGESRKLFNKTRSVAEVREDVRKRNFRVPRNAKDISIDTTKLSAAQTAAFIAKALR